MTTVTDLRPCLACGTGTAYLAYVERPDGTKSSGSAPVCLDHSPAVVTLWVDHHDAAHDVCEDCRADLCHDGECHPAPACTHGPVLCGECARECHDCTDERLADGCRD